ncbi:ABC transporter ATP-binding protein [Geosporobacter ferrireducens]|uniref:ABC transporter n=1 Tax=Geosporobacter ferrireducens TaxID=1424294 RepID=A0A1D8GEF4_9FIRM|nr:ABC transporter ATP-binding protein [Geosporobacter ferrireducens]AOT69299.1 ABC transporter [Geosporobacter ferrireducens]
MLKIIKYLKPFAISIVLIIGLLFIQAISDLALPDYTARIVNVGIQQGGIGNAVPTIIRKDELDKLKIFINAGDLEKVEENYLLLDKTRLSPRDLELHLKNYPLLDQEPLYMLNTKDQKVADRLNPILGKAIMIVSGIEKEWGNSDVFTVLSKMPEEQIRAMIEEIDEKFRNIPESMITQSAVLFIQKEYQTIGVNTNKLQTNYIIITGLKMLLIALLSAAASVIVGLLAARVAAGHSKNLRNDGFKKVIGFSNSEFDKFSTASLITRSTNDIQQIQMLMVMLLRIVFYAPILGIGGMIKVLNTNTSMGWIIAIAVVAILTLVVVLFGIAIPKFKNMQKLIDRLNLVTRESLIGILVIRAFNNEKYEEQKFDYANQDLTRTSLFVNRLMSLMMPMMMLIMNAITLLIVWIGAHQIDSGNMQVGDMMAFIQYTMQIIMAFLMISMVSIMFPRASVSAQRLAEVLDTEIAIRDLREPKQFPADIKGFIEFRNVFFKYPGAEEDVLSNINFTAKPGETTAFIGSTGSGKTTLINLIPRFYDVSEGEILIDGIDIREVSQHALREKIGYVPQNGVLFSGTIESNIKYGNKAATEEELRKAAEIAQVMDFIKTAQEGFDKEISQGGTNVSGGQKQRLAIARALIRKPEIYIFDDSFSALDFRTDAALRKALKMETAESTVLIVAQRISTIMNANKIIVLDEGKIAGIGTHQELLKTCEVYKQIALSQLSKEELSS